MKQPRTHLKALILALAAIGSPGLLYAEGTNEAQPAQGQEQQVDSTDSAELEAIEVTARRRYASGYQPISADVIGGGNTPLLEVPRSVNIVTPAVLEDHWGSDIFYPLTGTTKKWPESFNNADFGHFTD